MLFLCSLDPSDGEMKCKLGNALTGRISKLDILCIPLMPFDQTEAKDQSIFLRARMITRVTVSADVNSVCVRINHWDEIPGVQSSVPFSALHHLMRIG